MSFRSSVNELDLQIPVVDVRTLDGAAGIGNAGACPPLGFAAAAEKLAA